MLPYRQWLLPSFLLDVFWLTGINKPVSFVLKSLLSLWTNQQCKKTKVEIYSIEVENNTSCSRVANYISNNFEYNRRVDLEGIDSYLTILDLVGPAKTRIINIYRSFSPQNGVSQRNKFIYQLQLVKNTMNESTILLGDLYY